MKNGKIATHVVADEFSPANVEYEICENCESKHPASDMFHDKEGVSICPECWKQIKDLIRVEECSVCGDDYSSEDIISVNGKPICVYCEKEKRHKNKDFGRVNEHTVKP